MSKIKARDLTFDASQPAFLQRLRRQIAGEDPARHEIPIPRNKRLAQDDEEDAPTYVLEDTNQSLTKAEYDALVAGKDGKQDDVTKSDDDQGKEKAEDAQKQPKDNIAEAGQATKKRKAVKVIAGDEQEDGGGESKTAAKAVSKPKKKPKKVKLSFGDPEEG